MNAKVLLKILILLTWLGTLTSGVYGKGLKKARRPFEKVNDQENESVRQKRHYVSIHTLDEELKKLEKEYNGTATRLGSLDPQTCTILRKNLPSAQNGTYYINPQDQRSPSSMVKVYCDMTSENGVGVTVIGHDSEAWYKVDGFENAESYKRKITYDIPMEQIDSIISQSKFCKQFVKYECYNAGFWFGSNWTCWVSRQGSRMTYWGGAAAGSGKCACGMTNSCVDRSKMCNCDNNQNLWTEDSGYLTDKNSLPVLELRFGDTGILNSGDDEFGYHTLGKLLCWG